VIIFNLMSQGFEGVDPETGKANQVALEEEVADVMALSSCVIRYLNLNKVHISERMDHKVLIKTVWLDTVPVWGPV